jgi:uncharacterized protein
MMRDDQFEWEDAKALSNWRDHGVTFSLARAAFDDQSWWEDWDADPDEERFNRLCSVMLDGTLLVLRITYTERGSRIRIISARLATTHERRTYFANRP